MPPSLLALLLQELPGWFQSLVLCSIHPTHHFQRNLPVPVFSFYSPAWGSNLVIFYCLLCSRACLPSRWLLAQCVFLFLALLLFKTPPSPRSVVLIPSLMFFLYIILFGSVISFLKKSLIEGQLLYNIVLFSAIYHHESATSTFIFLISG